MAGDGGGAGGLRRGGSGEMGGAVGADGGEALPPVDGEAARHPLAVDEPLLQAGEGDVDGEAPAGGRRRCRAPTRLLQWCDFDLGPGFRFGGIAQRGGLLVDLESEQVV